MLNNYKYIVYLGMAVISFLSFMAYKTTKADLARAKTENITMRAVIEHPAVSSSTIVYAYKTKIIEHYTTKTATATIYVDKVIMKEPTKIPATIYETAQKPEIPAVNDLISTNRNNLGLMPEIGYSIEKKSIYGGINKVLFPDIYFGVGYSKGNLLIKLSTLI